jgi:hypothetical protein
MYYKQTYINRAHFHIQELFTDPAQLMTGGQGQGQGGFDGFQQQQQMNFNQSGIYTRTKICVHIYKFVYIQM